MGILCRPYRILLLGFLPIYALISIGASVGQGSDTTPREKHYSTYRISPLIIHTDLSASAAAAIAGRVNSVIDDAAAYWQRPVRGPIECFVVGNPDQWPDGQMPQPMARLMIAQVGGATQSRQVGHGIYARNIVRVFASARSGVMEHEIVHAYCGQTFAATGPLWYQEGMAQLFAFGSDRQRGVNCPDATLTQLGAKPKMTISQIQSGGQATRQLLAQFSDKADRSAELAGLISTTDWNQDDIRALRQIKQFYCWNWFLCHFLVHNTNYQSRFRAVGRAYLTKRQDRFATCFQAVRRELEFEYQFTLQHLARGYRVDLCCWDWKKTFSPLACKRSVRTRVVAARGYQATGVLVEAGQRYHFRTEGAWTHRTASASAAADTQTLEAVILHNYQLTAPFPLRRDGQFDAPCTGALYVRCRSNWDRIADNEGSVMLVLAR